MTQLSSKNDDKFDYLSSDIVYNSKTDVFRDVNYLIINEYEPRRKRMINIC